MNIDELITECHAIARERGFWDGVPPYNGGDLVVFQAKHVADQINHMLSEAWEAEKSKRQNDIDKLNEERADIAIVLLDLIGWMGFGLAYEQGSVDEPWMLIGEFADTFRKHGICGHLREVAERLISSLDALMYGLLETEMRKKMEINRKRPYRYGVHTNG